LSPGGPWSGSGSGNPTTSRTRETTHLSLDSMARRQVETVTSTTVDTNGTLTSGPTTVSTLTRHYGDTSDNPLWTYTDTPARAGVPAKQERAVTGEGISGYTATIVSSISGALTNVSLTSPRASAPAPAPPQPEDPPMAG